MNKTTLKTLKQIYTSLDFALGKAKPLFEKLQDKLDNMPENPSHPEMYDEIEGNIEELDITINNIELAIESVSLIVPGYFLDQWSGMSPEIFDQIYPPQLYPNNGENLLYNPKKKTGSLYQVKKMEQNVKPPATPKARRKGKKN